MMISRLTRAVVAIAACVIAISTSAIPTSADDANHVTIHAWNMTDHEAWVDISWAYKTTGWHIERAFCLKPKYDNQAYRINYNTPGLGPQVRVRWEIKSGDCRSGNLTVVEWKKDLPVFKKDSGYDVRVEGKGPYKVTESNPY